MKIIFAVIFWLSSITLVADSFSEYRLDSGDSIKISVYEEPELALETRLSDAATISYPFLGEIQVSGLTVGQLEEKITQGLKGDYLVNPNVTVSVLEYRQFYIHGEVENPGGFDYLPGLTLRKAIALAGGFTERASRNKMYVIRDGVEHTKNQGREISIDEELSPGDIVTIEQSFF
jgi:polysaccharide biosynthesis/export protein VpsN